MSKYFSISWWKIALSQRISTFYQAIGFKPKIVQKTVEGETFQFLIGDPTGKSWYDNSSSDNLEMRSIRELLLSGSSVVFECGAHHGLTTILLSRWVGAGKVVAFECLPANVEILKKNIELNNCANVTIVAKAVGANGTVNIRPDSNSAVSTSRNAISIASISLDTFAAQSGIIPDLIKIDVEGFEIDVLEGAREVLKRVPAIFVEVHSEIMERYGRKSADIWNYIDRNAYDVWIQPDDAKPPVPYETVGNLSTRVHLFFRPKHWDAALKRPDVASQFMIKSIAG
jgi:FkbM family methyltransferase